MVATTRVVIVLRRELGNQLKLANTFFDSINDALMQDPENEDKQKDAYQAKKRVVRIETAIHALGALTLGDLEDVDLLERF